MGLVARWRVLHNMAGVGLSIVVTSIVLRDWWGKVSDGVRGAPAYLHHQDRRTRSQMDALLGLLIAQKNLEKLE
jgi:hypothetical protein